MRRSRLLLLVTIALVALSGRGAGGDRRQPRRRASSSTRSRRGSTHRPTSRRRPATAGCSSSQQTGLIRIIKDGQLQATPFADLTKLVTAGGEQGLLGLAFHPDFAKNGRLFVYYTARSQHEQVWELHAKPGADTVSGRRASC